MTEEQLGSRSARIQQNKRAKKSLTPVVLVFAETMPPLNLFSLIVAFRPAIVAQEYYKNLIFTLSVLAVVNSSTNPVIYSTVSRGFRKAMKRFGWVATRLGSKASRDFPVHTIRTTGQRTSRNCTTGPITLSFNNLWCAQDNQTRKLTMTEDSTSNRNATKPYI